MNVLISHEHAVEFQGLCEHFTGARGDMVQDFTVATGPGESGRMAIYHIEDHSALATWIHLQHPEWIDYVWANRHRNAQVQDPADTFLQLVAEDLDGRRANTTP